MWRQGGGAVASLSRGMTRWRVLPLLPRSVVAPPSYLAAHTHTHTYAALPMHVQTKIKLIRKLSLCKTSGVGSLLYCCQLMTQRSIFKPECAGGLAVELKGISVHAMLSMKTPLKSRLKSFHKVYLVDNNCAD